MMFVHPITHDAHGLALKRMCLGILAPRRGCFSNHLPLRRVRILAEHFYRMENEVSYTIKNPVRERSPKHGTSYSHFIGKPYSCTSTNIL